METDLVARRLWKMQIPFGLNALNNLASDC